MKRDLVSIGRNRNFGGAIIVRLHPISMKILLMIGPHLISRWHKGLTRFPIEYFKGDGLGGLGAKSACQRNQPHEQQTANLSSRHSYSSRLPRRVRLSV